METPTPIANSEHSPAKHFGSSLIQGKPPAKVTFECRYIYPISPKHPPGKTIRMTIFYCSLAISRASSTLKGLSAGAGSSPALSSGK